MLRIVCVLFWVNWWISVGHTVWASLWSWVTTPWCTSVPTLVTGTATMRKRWLTSIKVAILIRAEAIFLVGALKTMISNLALNSHCVDEKWKGNFWICFAATVSEKSSLVMTLLFALFYIFAATQGAHNSVCAKALVKSMCACPACPVRAQIPAVLKRYYETVWIAPLNKNFLSNRWSCVVSLWLTTRTTWYPVVLARFYWNH